jgi:hypothetical protein
MADRGVGTGQPVCGFRPALPGYADMPEVERLKRFTGMLTCLAMLALCIPVVDFH